jgi:hypothetical protein
MTTHTTVASLLSSPSRWCKGTFARDAVGNPIKDPLPAKHSAAVAFCVQGALARVYPDTSVRLGMVDRLLAAIQPHSLPFALSVWNDHSTHATVLAAVRTAAI